MSKGPLIVGVATSGLTLIVYGALASMGRAIELERQGLYPERRQLRTSASLVERPVGVGAQTPAASAVETGSGEVAAAA